MEKEEVSVIIPTLNEEKNIKTLVERFDRVLSNGRIPYKLIFIDDHSADQTFQLLKSLEGQYPLKVYQKQGQKGKAFSIFEGVKVAENNHIVMIDADLQYPPEAILEILGLQQRDNLGVVVARRKIYKESLPRQIVSNTFSAVFGKLLHGLDFDIQSGLKFFRKDIIDYIDQSSVTPWTFDLSLLITARELGYKIGEVDIEFKKRLEGESKVRLLKTIYEIGHNALKLKFRKQKIFHLKPAQQSSMVGAGVIYRRKKLVTHTTLHSAESALQTITSWQKGALFLLISLSALAFYLNAFAAAISFIAVLTFVYFLDMVFNVYLVTRSLRSPPEINLPEKDIKGLDEEKLPVYSILCPLYKEEKVLSHFVDSIKKLDWPKNKLDVILLLEEDDRGTIAAAQRLKIPPYFQVVIVPHSEPKTKPKACNFGLCKALGEYLVVYDAEDRPEPDQLKKAYLGFQKVPKDIVCLQAKLNYYNPQQNLLTRLFTAEYSLWFDVILPGLQTINTIIPLGGTSNHFPTVVLSQLKGWDPFNVTEDCDLGVRLFKKGYKTAIINSTTFEEANSNVKNWLRQRSRWIKGYLQTYFVHMRHPIAFFRQYGAHIFIFQLIIGARISFMLINPFLWLMTITYFALNSLTGPTIEALYPGIVFYMAVISAAAGNFMYVYNYMIGCAKRKQWDLIKYVYLIPIYWLLAFVAALMAFYQLIIKPHYWEKTIHGFHLQAEGLEARPKFNFRSLLSAISAVFKI